MSALPAGHWSGEKERGAGWGIRLLVWGYRFGGWRLFRILLWPALCWFFLFGGRARRASRAFLQRAHDAGSPALPQPPGWRESFRHFHGFALQAFDKLRAWMGDLSMADVRVSGDEHLLACADGGRGGLLLTSHLGNAEISRVLATRKGLQITAVVFTAHAQRFNAALQAEVPEAGFNLLSVQDIGPGTIADLQQRIDAGEWLVIVGDRTPVHSHGRVTFVPFLGQPAAFAQGPFVLAQLLQCPVLSLFATQNVAGQYHVRLAPLFERVQWTRATRDAVLQACTATWVARLEQEALQAPFQWFNFFDFWQAAPASNSPSPQSPSREF